MLKKLTTMAASLEHGGGQMLPDPSGYLFWQLDCSPSKLAEAFEISLRDFNGRRSLEHHIATLTALKLVSHEATGPLDCPHPPQEQSMTPFHRMRQRVELFNSEAQSKAF
jgi:hypothetical protein